MTDQRMLARVENRDGVGVVRVEDVFATDAADLWSAITNPARLRRWIAHVEGDLREGGRLTARFVSSWEGTGVVAVCDPPRHLLLRMTDGKDTSSDVDRTETTSTEMEAWLTPVDGGTRLTIEDRGIPVDECPDHGAGWQVHLEDLRSHLEGRPVGDWHARWTELRPGYRVTRN